MAAPAVRCSQGTPPREWQLGGQSSSPHPPSPGHRAAVQGSLDEAAVERLKDDDAVSLLFDTLSRQYPQVSWQ